MVIGQQGKLACGIAWLASIPVPGPGTILGQAEVGYRHLIHAFQVAGLIFRGAAEGTAIFGEADMGIDPVFEARVEVGCRPGEDHLVRIGAPGDGCIRDLSRGKRGGTRPGLATCFKDHAEALGPGRGPRVYVERDRYALHCLRCQGLAIGEPRHCYRAIVKVVDDFDIQDNRAHILQVAGYVVAPARGCFEGKRGQWHRACGVLVDTELIVRQVNSSRYVDTCWNRLCQLRVGRHGGPSQRQSDHQRDQDSPNTALCHIVPPKAIYLWFLVAP